MHISTVTVSKIVLFALLNFHMKYYQCPIYIAANHDGTNN